MSYNSATIGVIMDGLGELCGLVTRAADNAPALDQLQERLCAGFSQFKTPEYILISALSKMLHDKDPWAVIHQRHVAQIGNAIARVMKLPDQQAENVETAALLQDIGLICIAPETAGAAASRRGEDPPAMKKHPVYSFEILKRIACVPDAVRRAVLEHHERMDGSGYPNGLAGENIGTEARILGIADTVDIRVTGIAQDPAVGVDVALAEIGRNKGILYDPDVADAVATVFRENKIVYPHLL
jgi:HD-GYP domain-containing protein (c-di-GMP phosphodiesterase class II)